METTVGEGVLGAASLANLCEEPGEPVGSFTGADTGAGSAVEGKDPTLREVAFHSDSAARNSPGDSMRRKRTWEELSLNLNSRLFINVRDGTTAVLLANHILATNAAVKVALRMRL